MMRRILAVGAVALGLMVATGCEPTATVTAVPSTTRPACRAITTVTGTVTPKSAFREVIVETQPVAGGTWRPWMWFESATDGRGAITASVSKNTGNYKLVYLAPATQATTRLRVRNGTPNGPAAVSTSWYVKRPTGC